MPFFSNKKLGILAAVPDEVKSIINNPKFKWEKIKTNFYKSPQNIYLIMSEIGKAYAVHAVSQLLPLCDEILMLGTSGGLGDEEVGSLYISTEFVEHDMDATGLGCPPGVTPFSKMKNAVLSNPNLETVNFFKDTLQSMKLRFHEGRTISGDQFLNNAEVSTAKRNLFKAQLVDMESASVAKICIKENKTFMALRYVTDNANHEAHTSWEENVKKSSVLFNQILEKIYFG